MSYHIDEQIEDHVVPQLKAFLASDQTYQKLSEHLQGMFCSDGRDDRLKALFLNAMFPPEESSRPGAIIRQIFNVLHEGQILKELKYEDGQDVIIEKFEAVQDDET